MRKTAVLVVALFVAGSASAVTNYSGPEDQPHIMSGPSETTEDTGPWRFDVVQTNASCMTGEEQVSDITVTEKQESTAINFTGTLESATPCEQLVRDIEVENSTYRLEISSKPFNGTCVQCTGGLDYTVEAEVPDDEFVLEVYHDGEKMTEMDRTREKDSIESSLFQRILSFFSNLF